MTAPIEITIEVGLGIVSPELADDAITVPASGPEETEMSSTLKPVINQPRRLTVNVANAPGTVGKALADITAVRMMAKRSPSASDASAVFDTGAITGGSQLTSAQATGEFYVFLAASDFGSTKIRAGISYYFVGAVKVSGYDDWIEADKQTRIEFKDDVVD